MRKKTKLGRSTNCNITECVGFAGRFKVEVHGYMEDSTPDVSLRYMGYMGKDASVKGLSAVSIGLSFTAKEAAELSQLLRTAAAVHHKKGKQFAKSLG